MLGRLQEIVFYNINVNGCRNYEENVLKNHEDRCITPSISNAKSVVSAVAVSSAEAERVFPKMNVIYSDRRNGLRLESFSNLITTNQLVCHKKSGIPRHV